MQACLSPHKPRLVPLSPTAAQGNKVGGREPREGFPRKRTSPGPLREEGTSSEKTAGRPLTREALGRKDGAEGRALVRAIHGAGSQRAKRERIQKGKMRPGVGRSWGKKPRAA